MLCIFIAQFSQLHFLCPVLRERYCIVLIFYFILYFVCFSVVRANECVCNWMSSKGREQL